MPGRNIIKDYEVDSYYHVYSRGVAKQEVFRDESDYEVFLSLFKRYLGDSLEKNRGHGLYPNFSKQVELLCFCLMPNHVHLLLYQYDELGMSKLMKSLMVSYGMYFNKKYKRVGPLFQSRYRASRIQQDEYLDHISRYIHLNPLKWNTYPYSSIKYYEGDAQTSWIKPEKIINLFPSSEEYINFVKDYRSYKDTMDEIHWDLADQ